jgi:hypothetical protein
MEHNVVGKGGEGVPGVSLEQAGQQARGQSSPQGQRGHQPVSRGHEGHQPVSRGHGVRQTVGQGGGVVHGCLSDADWYREVCLSHSLLLFMCFV